MYSNDGFEYRRAALTDVRRIAVEEGTSTSIPTIGALRAEIRTKGTKVLEPYGRIVIQQGEKKYGVEGLMIKD